MLGIAARMKYDYIIFMNIYIIQIYAIGCHVFMMPFARNDRIKSHIGKYSIKFYYLI